MFFRKRNPNYGPNYGPRNYYHPYPSRGHSSGIIFLLIILVGVYFAQVNNLLPDNEIIPFWVLALAIVVVFFLFKRRDHY